MSTLIQAPLYLDAGSARRFQDLLARFVELNDNELQELKNLRQQHREQQEARSHEIDAIRQKVRQLHIQPDELFDKNALAAVAGGSAAGATARRTPAPRKKWRKSDEAPVLLEMKPESGRGRAFVYRKGRIYEGMAPGKPQPAYTTLPASLARFGHSSQSVLSHLATPEGRQYFASPEGQAELEKIVETVLSFAK